MCGARKPAGARVGGAVVFRGGWPAVRAGFHWVEIEAGQPRGVEWRAAGAAAVQTGGMGSFFLE